MRVYAESNFVLEIVLAQEQHAACKDFVTLADRHEVELVLPAFSLFEPYTTLERRRQERHKLREQLERELTQIRRTQAFAKEASASSLPALLVESTQEAADQFNAARESLLRVARLLPLTTEVLRAALVAEVTHELEFPDAIVLASVLDDLAVIARLRASRVDMDRGRFAWRRLLLHRSVPVDDVVCFHPQARSDGEGGTSYVLIADLAPSAQATIWSDDSEALVNHLCGYLNEALFVVSAKGRPRVPYR